MCVWWGVGGKGGGQLGIFPIRIEGCVGGGGGRQLGVFPTRSLMTIEISREHELKGLGGWSDVHISPVAESLLDWF